MYSSAYQNTLAGHQAPMLQEQIPNLIDFLKEVYDQSLPIYEFVKDPP